MLRIWLAYIWRLLVSGSQGFATMAAVWFERLVMEVQPLKLREQPLDFGISLA